MKRFSSICFAALITIVVPAHSQNFSESTSENTKIVTEFYEQFFNLHDLSAADRYIGNVYIQHNPNVADGRKPFVDVFTKVFGQFPQRHSEIVRTIAQGDLVVLHVHLTKSSEDKGGSVVDIFRLENGRIVEHWDVQQPVPEAAANSNTMF